jgi:hypothetical protein
VGGVTGTSSPAGGAGEAGGVAGMNAVVRKEKGRDGRVTKPKQSQKKHRQSTAQRSTKEKGNTVLAVVVDSGATSKKEGEVT